MCIREYKKWILRIRKIPTEVFVFLLAFLYRLPSLGYDIINNDAYLWKGRGYTFGSELISFNFAKTAVTYHPGVPLLWSQFISNKVYSVLDAVYYHGVLNDKEEFLVNHVLQKLVLVIITSFLVALAYKVLRRIIPEKAAIVSVLLVLLEPFYLGLSRVIHTDVLLSLFMFISLLYFYISANKKTFKLRDGDTIKAGVFMGLAMLTKSAALFLIPFYSLVLGAIYIKKRESSVLKTWGVIFITSVLTFVLVWPAMWVAPISSLKLYLFQGVKGVALKEGHGHLWFGQETSDPGAAFYPVIIIARYSLAVLVPFLIGIFMFLKNANKKVQKRQFLFLLISFVFLYISMITFVSKKMDRYTLPILFPMAAVIGYYLSTIVRKKVLGVIMLAFIFSRIVLFYGLHPDYLAYYSPVVGGVEGGRFIVDPKWSIGFMKVADYFNSMDNPEKLKIVIPNHDYLRPYAKFDAQNLNNESERDSADYFVLPIYSKERNKYYLKNYDLEKIRDEIKIAGVEYYKIYKNHGKK